MSFFGLFAKRSTAEILEVIARHVGIDRDKVRVNLERGDSVSTLAIDVEMPDEVAGVAGRKSS